MGRSVGGTLFRLAVTGVALLFALAVVGTVVGLFLGILSAVFTVVVLLGLLVVVGAVGAGLLSLFGGRDDGDDEAATDWFETDVGAGTGVDAEPRDAAAEAERLRERYVAGEIDEVEYERRLDLLLDDPEAEGLFDEGDDREREPDW